MTNGPPAADNWRTRLHEIIFEADTPAGKAFDIALLIAILLSVLVVMLDSVSDIKVSYTTLLITVEWVFTILFTIEYVLRLICVRKAHRYALSFFGIVDLLAILPMYLALVFTGGGSSLAILRVLRLLRVFRILKLARYLSEADVLKQAVLVSRAKITVFLGIILIVVMIMGSAMYIVEGKESEFTSIPQSVYWAVVTMTTVGYGDMTPHTTLGKMLTIIITLLGYTLIIIPTGIISAELAKPRKKPITTQSCPDCLREGHDTDATHCKYCGEPL